MDAVKPKTIPERLTPATRAQRDPAFAALVSMMEGFIHSTEFTPTELREAVMLAAVNYEMRRFPRPIRIVSGIAEIVEPTAKPGELPPVLMIDGARYRLDTEPLFGNSQAQDDHASMMERVASLRSEVDPAVLRDLPLTEAKPLRKPRWAAVLPHLRPNAKRGTSLSREELREVQAQYPDNALRAIFELHWEDVSFPPPPRPAEPKPTSCEPGQYWEANDGAMGGTIVPGFASEWHEQRRLFRLERTTKDGPNVYEISEAEMLSNDLWTYHGEGTSPRAGD